ncbi:unnamed protein product [Arabidopsis lyrata]|nr:unnamed protein product [Arabidopsis lyrata]
MIKRQVEWTLVNKDEAVAAKKKSVETRKLIFKRAEQYEREYAEKDLNLDSSCNFVKPSPTMEILKSFHRQCKRECEYCNDGQAVNCAKGVFTFNGIDHDGSVTKGGYSSHIVVHERYCYKIPVDYPLESAAPLLCAGITVFAPMMHHNMNQPGKSLGVIGLGGLGHMAVKFGKAFGLSVTVFSTSISKKEEALNLLGAENFVISSDHAQMKALAKSLDFIIDTASGDHAFDPYMSLLKIAGTYVLVGFPSEIKISPANLNLNLR